MSRTSEWIKPSFFPPSKIFGIVWPILYIIITASFGYVFWMILKKELPIIIALPFILNIIFNLAFMPIQFRLNSFFLAAIDIILILITLIWAMIAIYPYIPIITYLQIPYFLWVSFATVLQLSCFYLNYRK
jgi:tryptophan-rich sensory protein